jgi:hypothetical protein
MDDRSPLEILFFAALEKSSAEERAAYLDEASPPVCCRISFPIPSVNVTDTR